MAGQQEPEVRGHFAVPSLIPGPDSTVVRDPMQTRGDEHEKEQRREPTPWKSGARRSLERRAHRFRPGWAAAASPEYFARSRKMGSMRSML